MEENLLTFEDLECSESKNANWRSRIMLLLLYPQEDVSHAQALERIKTQCYNYLGICHNRDVYGIDCENAGELKKEHVHVFLKFPQARYVNAVATDLGITRNYIRKSAGEKISIMYFLHTNEPDKYQYDAEDCYGTLLPLLNKYLKEGEDEGMRAIMLLNEIEKVDRPLRFSEVMRIAAEKGLYSDFRRAGSLFVRIIDEHNRREELDVKNYNRSVLV